MPFTRKPMMVIVDSKTSYVFKVSYSKIIAPQFVFVYKLMTGYFILDYPTTDHN